MSIAEIKEAIVKRVVLSNDTKFLNEVADFINDKSDKGEHAQSSDGIEEIDAFYERLKAQHGDVLQKLAL